MSLFRSEPRKEHSRLSTADVAAMGNGRDRPAAERPITDRPAADARPDGAAAHADLRDPRRAADERGAQRRIDERDVQRRIDERDAQRRVEPREPLQAETERASRQVDVDVEDAVVRSEQPRADGHTPSTARDASKPLAPLFSAGAAQEFRSRWDATQIGFVDDPRRAVQQADELVAEVMKSLAQSFADERSQLEAQMRGDEVSTEHLRVALQRYRSFFQRLLSL